MKYSVADWEVNGYQDSDFKALYWSPEDGFSVVEVGSTRYGGGGVSADLKAHPPVPAELLPVMREALAEKVARYAMGSFAHRVLNPMKFAKGEKVKFLKDGKAKIASKDDKGSVRWVEVKAGDEAEVFWSGHFGSFYRNGYNRPNRDNGRLGLILANGDKVFVGMNKVRLSEEIPSNEWFLERARNEVAYHGFDPAPLFGGAWSSAVYSR